MKHRTIALRLDTVAVLNRLRQGDESFNSVISRLAKRALLYAQEEERRDEFSG